MSLLDYSVEELARLNSPQLLATQLQSAIRDSISAADRYARMVANVNRDMDLAHRIGLEVMKARAAGRKTIWLDSLPATPERPSA